ncbi:H-NS family nucleoid-associated regulatory protein [Poseidonocella sedimentorum]|uniref:DNA-binding protein H-NS n=1 Tax=Poseidonocella sedimentorum TaxID=871652 RepID=A0A1I6DS15_9RHOB|nr:H-NS histone family protein [Poseidonocella sedimentorum]SFR08182.1 DNA-binding protein H-NS [Poseidonocella sedimentorum]
MAIDLEKMSRDELLQLRADIDKALKTVDARSRSEARVAAEKAAKEFGYSLDELLNKSGGKDKNPPKYRHPEDPTKTWTGRGRKPAWVIDWIDAGKDVEDLAI